MLMMMMMIIGIMTSGVRVDNERKSGHRPIDVMKRENSGGRRYHVWSEREEQALKKGVQVYGVGAWEVIRQDEAFAILKQRSGVQLKDKWRNLVKFRKVDGNELRNLPKRVSGPWSKKAQIIHFFNDAVVANEAKGRHHQIGHESRKRNYRLEDRRYGIYDFRRYVKKPNFPQQSSSVCADYCGNVTSTEPSYTVACICGVDHDDGQRMIECERCKEWAHTTCLQEKEKYSVSDYTPYICWKCQKQCYLLREETSSMSDCDIWFPLELKFQSKRQRLRRRPRSEFASLCRFIQSFSTKEPEKTTAQSQEGINFTNFKFKNSQISPFSGGGLSVTTAAYILTEQLKAIKKSDLPIETNTKKRLYPFHY